jgi:hypothetical protein
MMREGNIRRCRCPLHSSDNNERCSKRPGACLGLMWAVDVVTQGVLWLHRAEGGLG